jgi:hypothetical protein
MRAPSPTLPPWQARSDHDRQWLLEWTIEQLDAQDAEDEVWQSELNERRDYYAPLPEEEQQRIQLDRAIRRARRGDVEALRELYPEIADFIHQPPRRRGQHRSPYRRNQFGRYGAELIVDNVKRVHDLWRRHYDGRWKRRGRPTAAEIVAARWHLDEKKVIAAVRLLSR